MKIRPFQAIYPNIDFVASPDSFCSEAKTGFQEFKKNGLFKKAPADALYSFQIENNGRKHTGLIANNDLADFHDGRIKKHENTLSEKEQQQMQLFVRWQAILKPVLLVYKKVAAISDWLEDFTQKHKPFFTVLFEKDGQVHRAWAVSDGRQIRELQELFEKNVHTTYIADGHHRTTTVALLNERLREKNPEFDFRELFCAFFPSDQLDILDYNRVVEGLKDVSPMRFMARMAQLFDVEFLEKPAKPRHKHELTMCAGKEWFRLKWRPEVLAKSGGEGRVLLDANLLNEHVLGNILGIRDPRTDTRITYVEGPKGIRGIEDAAEASRNRIGFMLFPVALDDLMALSDMGEMLPPKSTYFEPRLRSGLIVKEIKE